ncbi:MAG: sodium:proton antiporter [Pedobacter sp.]|nr:MAG: sodium:proton antiporter [Pedobacter sp.]
MNQFLMMLLLIGVSSLGMVYMPAFSKKIGISYALIYVVIGVVLYALLKDQLPSPLPKDNEQLTLHLTELIVVISLMGTGIKIDRPFSLKNWSSPLKLISIAMFLCIGVVCFLGFSWLHMLLPSALLLGAVLAPTDPVLAEDVQVGPPNEKIKSETKFALTSEAGLNDGMAFPFIWLAITLCLMATDKSASLLNWFGYHFVYKISIGLLLGYMAGKGFGYLTFTLPEKYKLLKPKDGFLAIALTFVVYAVTEFVHGYGFIAVFICAINLRHADKKHTIHTELYDFTTQIERLMLGILLMFFGGALWCGLLAPLTLKMAAFSLVFLFVIRPFAAYISLLGNKMHFKERLAISFFGIRGMGSIFYLSFALITANFGNKEELWTIVAFTILISVFIHGLSASRIMKHLTTHMPKEKIPQ